MTPVSLPHLFALAHGRDCAGPEACFFCGAPCGQDHPAADFVRDSFTGRNDVARPGSDWVCPGCVLCLREDCEVAYHDGERRRVTKAAMRMHSWVVTPAWAVAATKAHLPYLRSACLSPPEPPFAVSLADSGQKQLLYRGVVCRSREVVAATLEGERIDYRPPELEEMLTLCGRLCAAAGKPALSEPPDARLGLAFLERYPDAEEDLAAWGRLWQSPLGRLAAWLSPGRDAARELYPAA